MLPEVRNWGRWGDEDELGQLNLMTPERILHAVRLVTRGKLYNLAVPLERDGPQAPHFHKTWRVTHFTADPHPDAANMADDVVIMETHSGTHIDALGHFWKDGTMWNGRSARSVTSDGLDWAGIHQVPGLVARGVMLDLARFKGVGHLALGEEVTPDDMDACAASQGVTIEGGDVLLLRTGWYTLFDRDRDLWSQGEPGPDVGSAAWLKGKDPIALGADTPAVERLLIRERDLRRPRLHTHALRDLGVYLIENLNLEDLARDEVYEFLFVAAPLRLTKGTGSPFSPLALV